MTGGKLVTGNMIGGPEQNGSGGKMGIEKALCMFIFYTYSKIELIIIIIIIIKW